MLNTHSNTPVERQPEVPDLGQLSLNDEEAISTPPELNDFQPHFQVYLAPAFTNYGDYRGGSQKSADIFLGIKPNNVPAGPGEGQDRWIWSKAETHVFTEDSCDFWGECRPVVCYDPAADVLRLMSKRPACRPCRSC